MNKVYTHAYTAAIDAVINNKKIIKATKFISPTEIVRAVRRQYGKKNGIVERPKGNVEITLTIGKPNYDERAFIKLCKKMKETFPIPDVVLKFAPINQKPKKKK